MLSGLVSYVVITNKIECSIYELFFYLLLITEAVAILCSQPEFTMLWILCHRFWHTENGITKYQKQILLRSTKCESLRQKLGVEYPFKKEIFIEQSYKLNVKNTSLWKLILLQIDQRFSRKFIFYKVWS